MTSTKLRGMGFRKNPVAGRRLIKWWVTMAQETITLEKPTVHLVHMLVFTLVVAVIGAVLFPAIQDAFMANPGLNGLIVATLVLGMLYALSHGVATGPGGELGQ